MAAELSVKIGADVSELNGQLNQVQQSLKLFEKKIGDTQTELKRLTTDSGKVGIAIEKLNNDFSKGVVSQTQYEKKLERLIGYEKRYTQSIKETKAELTQLNASYKTLGGSTGTLGNSVGKLGKETANAVSTLTSFSQVIQDAPYGIRGVANNITQLTSQFGYLAKSVDATTGKTLGAGGALKALGSSLLSPAGILFAVSAITSALVTYEDEILGLFDSTKKAANAQKELRKELESSKVVLDSRIGALDAEIALLEAQGKSTEALKKEKIKILEVSLANLGLQKQSLQTEIATAKAELARIGIIDKIRLGLAGITGIAFTPISDDDIKQLNELETALNDIDKTVVQTQLTLGKLKTPELFKGEENKKQIESALKRVNKLKEELGDLGDTFDFGANPTTLKGLEDLEKAIKNRIKSIQDYTKTISFINKDEVKFAEDREQEKLDAAITFANKTAEATGAIAKKSATDQKEFFVSEIEAGYKQIIDSVAELQNALKGVQGTISRFGLDPKAFDLSGLNLEQLDELAFKLQNTQQVAQVFGSAIGSSLQQMSATIGEALSTGNEYIDSFVQSLLNSLVQFLAQLITQQIAQAAATSALQAAQVTSANATALGLSAASGIAAQSQGVQIATSFAASLGPAGFAALPGILGATFATIQGFLEASRTISAFATGGFTGDNHLIRVNGNEAVLTAAEVFSFRNQIKNHQLNSNFRPMENNVELTGEVILRGNTQVVQLRRAEKKMSRFYNS